MTTEGIMAIFIAFIIAVAIGPLIIPVLKKMKLGNTEREELESHQVKTGTPTMGGFIIIVAFTLTSLIYASSYPKVIIIVLVTLAFGGIGFIDDYLKVVKHDSDGLLPKEKMILQVLVTGVFALYLHFSAIPMTLRIPFTGGKIIDIGLWAILILFLAMIGTVNGVNFTDGVDGLVSTVTVPISLLLLAASMIYDGQVEPACGAMIGALLGFLVFNVYPAKVFMGDTGSLALGAFVATTAYMMQMPIFIIIFGLVYLVEVLSVIIQVAYFRKTGGKRIFRMAPIHHHFELGGWSETKVVGIFAIITILLCLVAYLGL